MRIIELAFFIGYGIKEDSFDPTESIFIIAGQFAVPIWCLFLQGLPTQFIYRRPSRFRIAHLVQPDDLNELRWTVDTPDDFEFVTAVYGALLSTNPDFGQSDILKLLEDRPGLVRRA